MPGCTVIIDNDSDFRIRSAVALFRRRDLAAARSECEALIATPRSSDGAQDIALQAQACYWATRSARRQEQPDAALRFVYEGLAAARRSAASRVECLLRAELVHVLSGLGQNNDALEQADAAMQRARHLQDAVGTAAAQEALASIHWMTGDWEPGLEAYTEALALACDCNHLELRVLCTLGLAATEEGVAGIAREAGRPEEAETRLRRSVQLQRDSGVLAGQLGDDYLVMYSQLNEGCSLHSLGALEEAQAVFETCLDNPAHEAVHGNVLTMLGRIEFDRGDARAALPHLLQALQVTERLDKPYPTLRVLQSLVDVHEALGNLASALATMRRFHALHVKNASDKARLLARAISIKYDTERAIAVARAQRQRADTLERSNADLASEAALHERASMEDALTGVANRRRFDRALQALVRPDGQIGACSVALLDIDHFKQVNDTFSHLVGDEVLRRIGALLLASCRRGDVAARYGGEEFVLLVAGVARDEMRALCERIRQGVAQHPWPALRAGLHVTVSIGLAHHDELPSTSPGSVAAAQALMALADARLYAAKDGGRNRVCDQGPPPRAD